MVNIKIHIVKVSYFIDNKLRWFIGRSRLLESLFSSEIYERLIGENFHFNYYQIMVFLLVCLLLKFCPTVHTSALKNETELDFCFGTRYYNV